MKTTLNMDSRVVVMKRLQSHSASFVANNYRTSMVPSKMNRHLNSDHPSHANKDKLYFQRQLEQNKKQKLFMKSIVTVSEKALEASYHVAKLIALPKKPHTISETLITPACMEIVRLMLGANEVKEVNKVSLSADTMKRRIDDTSSDILETLIG